MSRLDEIRQRNKEESIELSRIPHRYRESGPRTQSHDDIAFLLSELERKDRALREADAVLHGEFCCGIEHHPACLAVDQALADPVEEEK